MGKRRSLNGLPNSLVQRYFSGMFWWGKAFMSDWIWHAANEKGVIDIEIDILNDAVEPKVIEIEPITGHLVLLRQTIRRTLSGSNFPEDFIVEAKFKIYISQKYKWMRLLSCKAILKDRNGYFYESKTYTEQAYERVFKVFPVSIWTRIKRVFK